MEKDKNGYIDIEVQDLIDWNEPNGEGCIVSNKITKEEIEEKCKFCLVIAEKAKEFLSDNDAKVLIDSAIKKGWEWIDGKRDVSEELYDYLDNEDNGFTVLQEYETDEIIIKAWDTIIDAVAFVCKSSYLEAGAQYFPEPIALVDDDTIDHMVESFLFCHGRRQGV